MTPFDSLVYVIDFRNSSNCSRIQSVQPGEEILVLVHPEQKPCVDPLGAKGTRSQDGALFIITEGRPLTEAPTPTPRGTLGPGGIR